MSDRRKQNENLIPLNDRSPEEARAIRAKGGIASGKTKRKKKAMKEAVEAVLSLKAPAKMKDELKNMGFKNEDCINQTIMILQVFRAACKGDIRAAEFMRDTGGEAPQTSQPTKLEQEDDDPLTKSIFETLEAGKNAIEEADTDTPVSKE